MPGIGRHAKTRANMWRLLLRSALTSTTTTKMSFPWSFRAVTEGMRDLSLNHQQVVGGRHAATTTTKKTVRGLP